MNIIHLGEINEINTVTFQYCAVPDERWWTGYLTKTERGNIYKWNNIQTKSMVTDDEVTYEVSIGTYYPSVGTYDADQ